MIKKIYLNDQVITYNLTRKKVKNINLRIRQDGTIMVSANTAVKITTIEGFIKENSDFILKSLEEIIKNSKNNLALKKQYINGDTLKLLGEDYKLKIIYSKENNVMLKNSFINLYLVEDIFEIKEQLISDWYKKEAKKYLNRILKYMYEKVEPLGVPMPKVTVRNVKTIWGSCNKYKCKVTLNTKLVQAPLQCIEYVALHELVHLIHPNHSKDFYTELESLMPNWKSRKDELRDFFK
ncbi:MAG: M48 family metallopeptidase [Lachnospirales bacterium]